MFEVIKLADGREIPTDLVVFLVGIRPYRSNKESGLDVNRGIVVNDVMQTE